MLRFIFFVWFILSNIRLIFIGLVLVFLYYAVVPGADLPATLKNWGQSLPTSFLDGAGTVGGAVKSDLTSPQINVPKGARAIWTATPTRTARENADAHFRKHKHEFGFKTVDEYVRAATRFLHNPPPGVQTKIEQDGDVLRFLPKTGEFGVMRRDFVPRTYFILDPRIHGFSSNEAYFDAQ